MAICAACQKSALLTDKIGKVVLCKSCCKRIQAYKWLDKKFATNEEVISERNIALTLAVRNAFPDMVFSEIRQFFNSQIEESLIRLVDGHRGQLLKVYENKCVIVTESQFNLDEHAAEFAKARKRSQPTNGKPGAAEAAVRGFLTGGVVQTGLSLAATAGVDAISGQMSGKRELQHISEGSQCIYYENCDGIRFVSLRDVETGYISFFCKQVENSPNEIYFIFRNHSSCTDVLKPLCATIEAKIRSAKGGGSAAPPQQAPNHLVGGSSSVADEILKYKNLLDMGAITEQEFETKKKQLLGL